MAWFDWAAHLAGAPGRWQYLAELAARLALRNAIDALGQETEDKAAGADPRFAHPAWRQRPSSTWRAANLAQEE